MVTINTGKNGCSVMKTKLNNLEKAILEEIVREHTHIRTHIPFLGTKSRVLTGLGMYVNLCYSSKESLQKLEDSSLSVNKFLSLDNLENGLGFELDISNGWLNFIELFTYLDEQWDGNFKRFHFEFI